MTKLIYLFMFLTSTCYASESLNHKINLIIDSHLTNLEELVEKNREAINDEDFQDMIFHLGEAKQLLYFKARGE